MNKVFFMLGAFNRVLCWLLFWSLVAIAAYFAHKFTRPEEVSSFPYIARIDIIGEITPGLTDRLKSQIDAAYGDPNSKVVLFNVDSPGGSGYESWRLCDYIMGKREEEEKKDSKDRRSTVSVIAAMGTSAAFHIALCAGTVYSSPHSQIGSVGAIIRYLESEQRKFKSISSGKGKVVDYLTPESRKIAKELVDEGAEVFLQEVLKLRGERLKITAKELATGRTWSGKKGLQYGLIDGFATPESLARGMHLPLVWTGIQEPTVWDKIKDVLSGFRSS